MQNETRVPVKECQANPELLRGIDREDEQYKSFRTSVEAKGVLQPILVRPIAADKVIEGGPKYFIVDGLQRWSASCDAGLSDIPVRIVEMTDKEVRDAQIIANAHRVETKPKEYAEALKRMLDDDPMLTKDDLADRLNISKDWLDKRLSLTKLDDEIGELVDENKITLQNAIILAKLTPEDQKLFVQDAMTKDAGSLGASVQTHKKEQAAARKEGRPEGPVVYVPTASLMKAADIEAFYKDKAEVAAFLESEGVLATKDNIAVVVLASQRVVNLNPLRVKARIDQYNADKVERDRLNEEKKQQKAAQKEVDAVATRQRLEAELSGVSG